MNPNLIENAKRLKFFFNEHPSLAERYNALRKWSFGIRSSEYHITNACNIRCKGCWFFLNDFDKATRDDAKLENLRAFVKNERNRGVNTVLLIGGEPTLFPKRVAVYVDEMDYVTISTNGYTKFSYEGFENVSVAISLFGGGTLDDELRAIRPNGKRFSGLFDIALANYKNDPRVAFAFAVTETGISFIEETVRKIHDNGNMVRINFYSQYDTDNPLRLDDGKRLIDEILRVKSLFPNTLLSHPYVIETMITGKTHWGTFGYEVCPCISVDHPAHKERKKNGNPILPLFNAYAPDLKSVLFCCTSGKCNDCRDSQVVLNWILISTLYFADTMDHFRTWIEIAESYWRQLIWSPYHPSKTANSDQVSTVVRHGSDLSFGPKHNS